MRSPPTTSYHGTVTESEKANIQGQWRCHQIIRLISTSISFSAIIIGLLMTFNVINVGIHTIPTGSVFMLAGLLGILTLILNEFSQPPPKVYVLEKDQLRQTKA